MSKTVVLIHGAWLTPLSWEAVKGRYEAKGYTVHAPSWPHEDMPLAQLRRSQSAEIKKLTTPKIVDHYDRFIRALPEKPIIIGHSFGGLFTQMLLDRGLGVAGVAIDPAPMRGVLPRPRVFISSAPVFLVIGGWNKLLTMSFKSFATTFANGLPENQKRDHFDRLIAPTPGRIFYQAAFGVGTGIHPRNPNRAPLLMISGEIDKTVDPPTVRAAFRKQKHNPNLTEFKSFPGRSHFLCIEPGWEEVADYSLDWAAAHQRP